MDRDFFRLVLTRKPALWRAMLTFNGLVPEVRPTLPPLPTDWNSIACLSRPWLETLWTQALRHLATPPPVCCAATPDREYFWDFAEESRRLALLATGPVLERLILVFGAALHAEEIAKVVRKAELEMLHTAIGRDVTQYALTRGRFQLAASPTLFAERQQDLPLSERVLLHGRQALEYLCAGWPQALQNCVSPSYLDLGNTLNMVPNLALKPHQRVALWQDMKKILLKEVAPAWQPCFD